MKRLIAPLSLIMVLLFPVAGFAANLVVNVDAIPPDMYGSPALSLGLYGCVNDGTASVAGKPGGFVSWSHCHGSAPGSAYACFLGYGFAGAPDMCAPIAGFGDAYCPGLGAPYCS